MAKKKAPAIHIRKGNPWHGEGKSITATKCGRSSVDLARTVEAKDRERATCEMCKLWTLPPRCGANLDPLERGGRAVCVLTEGHKGGHKAGPYVGPRVEVLGPEKIGKTHAASSSAPAPVAVIDAESEEYERARREECRGCDDPECDGSHGTAGGRPGEGEYIEGYGDPGAGINDAGGL